MDAEEYVAEQLAEHPHVFPCGHVDVGEAGCGGCADEREAEARADARVVAAYEALCPMLKPDVVTFGWLRRLVRMRR